MTGKFYGLGVGPGDPELITMKAINIANKVDVLIAPETVIGKGSIAYDIINRYVENKEKVRLQTYPMTYNRQELGFSWNKNVKEIFEILQQNKDVAFVTLGDPMTYSTYIYIMRLIAEKGVTVETVPGITSFCASASRLNIPLAEGNETIVIIPAAYECDNLDDIINQCDNIVMMKPSKNFEKVAKKLEKHNLSTVMIQRCGYDDEKIIRDLKSVDSKNIPYLSMIIAKKKGE